MSSKDNLENLARSGGLKAEPPDRKECEGLLRSAIDRLKDGASTSQVEVTNISQHGFWLLLADEEQFLPFSEFPWFRDVAVGKILHVELPSSNHLYWPDIDVDLAVESIRHPEQFPLVSQASV
ncbi:MAG: DUF2442 domain-containing protein [Sulfuritalea sp.]|nr:DUF2442 domain-containing protein [Sulfuritalea sp.]MDP1984938.1 DUF2442 domain-containing protein [Sulfuritalea sp.]